MYKNKNMNKHLIESHKKAVWLLSELYKYETNADFKKVMDEKAAQTINPGINYKEILLPQIKGYLQTQNENIAIYIKVSEHDFSKRVRVVFERMDISTFSDIIKHTKEDFKKIRNMGSKSLSEIEAALTRHNLSFKQL